MLYVGKDYALKGVAHLLDAADLLGEAGRLDIHFVLVGAMSDATQARVAAMPNVSLMGFQTGSALAALYASSDMSVVPSSWENFPFVVMEAMSSGIPVIGSRVGGIPEMIVDGQTGVLVDITRGQTHGPRAGAILAESITRLVDDGDLRIRMGARARERVLERFSERRLGEDLMCVFRGVTIPDSASSDRQAFN